ncbi:MAG: hypothetical protein SGPRY_004670 [Prymnesium sp.]
MVRSGLSALLRSLRRRKRCLIGRSRDWSLHPSLPALRPPLATAALSTLARAFARLRLPSLLFPALLPSSPASARLPTSWLLSTRFFPPSFGVLSSLTPQSSLPRRVRIPLPITSTPPLHAPSLSSPVTQHAPFFGTCRALRSSSVSGCSTHEQSAGKKEREASVSHERSVRQGDSISSPLIHSSAVVHPAARVGRGVEIGPFCVVGQHVALSDGVRLHSHVVVEGHTTIGEACTIFSHATVGAAPQDRKHSLGESSQLRIGRECRIFEYAHLSGGTRGGGGLTSIGDNCIVMSHTHVGHDCSLGSNVVLASGAALAGHVVVGDHATISGHSCVHQRVSIGRGAFLAGASTLVEDLIPFGLAIGNRAQVEAACCTAPWRASLPLSFYRSISPPSQLHSLNLRGIRRSAIAPSEQRAMLRAFRFLFQLPCDRYYKPLLLPRCESLQE